MQNKSRYRVPGQIAKSIITYKIKMCKVINLVFMSNFGRFLNKSEYKVNFLCANISEISTKSESREL